MVEATTSPSPRTPPPRDRAPGCATPTFDPALIGLAWALAFGAGRIPLFP